MARPDDQLTAPPTRPQAAAPAIDDAWRALQLVVDFVKHAESKSAATLAFAGVQGSLLFTLVNQEKKPGALLMIAAVTGAVATVVAAVAAGVALRPRLRPTVGKPPRSLLFYRSIATCFPSDSEPYVRDFTELTADRPALLAAVSSQIWANSVVASRKYRAVTVAVNAALAGAGALAVTATLALF